MRGAGNGEDRRRPRRPVKPGAAGKRVPGVIGSNCRPAGPGRDGQGPGRPHPNSGAGAPAGAAPGVEEAEGVEEEVGFRCNFAPQRIPPAQKAILTLT